MARNSYLKTFADEKVGVNGLLYKAGLTELTDTLEGYGRGYDGNSWESDTGTSAIENGGLKTDATQGLVITFPTGGRNDAIRAAFQHRGALQIDMHVDDLVYDTDTANYVYIDSYHSGADSIETPVYITGNWPALGSEANFDAISRNANSGDVYPGGVTKLFTGSDAKLGLSSGFVVTIHKELADNDGFFTYGISWDGGYQYHNINGTYIGKMPQENDSVLFEYFLFQASAARASMRNLLIYNRPFERDNKADVRISMAGHSFFARQKNFMVYNSTLHTIGGDVGSSSSYTGLDAINPTILQNVNCEADVYCYGVSGSNLATTKSTIIDGTMPTSAQFTGSFTDAVKRYRPHFCVIESAPFNNNGVATLAADIHAISVDLMAIGIIPVWVIDYNNVDLDYADEAGDMLTEITRQRAANDMGLVDLFTHFGGLPSAEYRADEVEKNHPNLKGQKVIGELIAAEINRLLLDPPNYSRLVGGFGQYETIAAP